MSEYLTQSGIRQTRSRREGSPCRRLTRFFAEGQFKKPAEDNPLRLLISREAPLVFQIVRILRLLIEVRSVVEGLRERVARAEFDFVGQAPVE